MQTILTDMRSICPSISLCRAEVIQCNLCQIILASLFLYIFILLCVLCDLCIQPCSMATYTYCFLCRERW